jgi:protein-tyrosine phosphatase
MKILMVCLGNICRSPLAEGILQQKANKQQLNWVVESAGTNGFHNGEPPHPLSQKVAKANGIDISQQISRQFVANDFDSYDKIYVMAGDVYDDVQRMAGVKFDSNKIDFFLNEINPNTNAAVPDPWYGNEDGYVKVYKLIAETCDAIIEKYK